MALGNLADLEELEPTPGRPDPLTLYHKVGTSQEGIEGKPSSGWGPLLPGDREVVGEERGASCVLGAVTHPFPIWCLLRAYSVQSGLSEGCSGFPAWG